MRAQQGLRVGHGTSYGASVYTVIGPEEQFTETSCLGTYTVMTPAVQNYNWLRAVNDGKVYISLHVAFGYYHCGHNIFFKWNGNIEETCPLDDGGYLEYKNTP